MTAAATVSHVPLDEDLAKQLARASDRVDKAQAAWEELVLLAFAQGASLREIGEAAGITHVGVKKLVARRQQDVAVQDEQGNVLGVVEAKATATRPDVSIEQIRRWKIIYTVDFTPVEEPANAE